MELGLTRVRIREANVPDAAAIAKVQVDSWRTTYTRVVPAEYLAQLSYEQHEQVWRDILSTHGATEFVYVAEAEPSNIIGFASGGPERSGNTVYKAELYAIYLLEGYQRKGIGGQLVQAIAERLMQEGLHSMLVWVLANNPSQDFYSALGGQRAYEQEVTIGGARLMEVAYGWLDIRLLVTTEE